MHACINSYIYVIFLEIYLIHSSSFLTPSPIFPSFSPAPSLSPLYFSSNTLHTVKLHSTACLKDYDQSTTVGPAWYRLEAFFERENETEEEAPGQFSLPYNMVEAFHCNQVSYNNSVAQQVLHNCIPYIQYYMHIYHVPSLSFLDCCF